MKLRQGDGEDAPGVVEDDDRVDAGRTTPSSTTTDAGSSSGSGGGGPGNLLVGIWFIVFGKNYIFDPQRMQI